SFHPYSIDYRFGCRISSYTVPCLDQEVQIGVVDVFTERWVRKYVVYTGINYGEAGTIPGCDCGIIRCSWERCKRLNQSPKFPVKNIPRRNIYNMRCDIKDTAQVTV